MSWCVRTCLCSSCLGPSVLPVPGYLFPSLGLGLFSTIISSNTASIPFSLFSFYNPVMQLLTHLMLSLRSPCCFCSVTQSCLTLCNPMDCSTPGCPVVHYLLEFAQIHVHWCHPTISSSVTHFSSCPQSFLAAGSFPVSVLFASGDKLLELQLQQQFFKWTCRIDFL